MVVTRRGSYMKDRRTSDYSQQFANGNHPKLQTTRQHTDPLQPAIVSTLDRDRVVALLRSHKATLKQRFGVAEVALFGSYARDHAAENSDVDFLVSIASPPDWS